MKKIFLTACFALPVTVVAAPATSSSKADLAMMTAADCPEVAALYQPVSETMNIEQPGREPRKVMVPKLGAAPPPLHSAVMALALHMAPQAESLPPESGVFQAMGATAMLDNTYRSAFMRCDLSELWVVSRGGYANSTRWYGPYKLADVMSALGDAAPLSQ